MELFFLSLSTKTRERKKNAQSRETGVRKTVRKGGGMKKAGQVFHITKLQSA